jgi:OmpA-OmpF porin, OOP family
VPLPIEVFFKKEKPSLKGANTLSSSLTADGLANLNELTALLGKDASLKVQLVGKASQEGDEPYNLDLGRRRAEMIADALEAKGLDSSRVTDVPRGDLPSACEDVRSGVVTCGEAGATNEKDRQVLARLVRP